MPEPSFDIADLLDYEAQLAQDELEPIQTVIQRDRTIGKAAPVQNDRRALLHHWLDQVREHNPTLPGRTWVQTSRFTLFACVVLGIFGGSGLMHALLAYDGTRPVSVFPFLGIFVLLQILFLAMLLLVSLFHSVRRKTDTLGFFPDLILRWLRTNIKDVFRRQESTPRASTEFMKRFHRLHAPLEAAIAMKFFQTFVLAFHVTALCTFLYIIAFSDIAFSWATTPRLSPPIFHDVTSLIATPFAWLGEAFVPDLRFIELTQYSRLEGRYVLAPPGARLPSGVNVGAWWPFLAACILTYAVLPRFFLVLWEKHAIRRYLGRRKFDDHASLALEARLTKPAGVWATTKSPSRVPEGASLGSTLPRLSASVSAPCLVIKWFGFPAEETALRDFLRRTFRLNVVDVIEASGTASDLERISARLHALHTKDTSPLLLIAADPWEVPGEAAEKLLCALRSSSLENMVCLFAPLTLTGEDIEPASAADMSIWRQSLRTFRDPYSGLVGDLGASS